VLLVMLLLLLLLLLLAMRSFDSLPFFVGIKL
jgi:hypothetical protein